MPVETQSKNRVPASDSAPALATRKRARSVAATAPRKKPRHGKGNDDTDDGPGKARRRNLPTKLSLYCLISCEPAEQAFLIHIDANLTVGHLKEAIKREENDLYENIPAEDIELYKVPSGLEPGRVSLNPKDGEELATPYTTLVELFSNHPVGHIHVIALGPDAVTSAIPNQYKHLVMAATVQSIFTEQDLEPNRIFEERSPNASVQSFEELLGRPRLAGDDVKQIRGPVGERAQRVITFQSIAKAIENGNDDIDPNANLGVRYSSFFAEIAHILQVLVCDFSPESPLSSDGYNKLLANTGIFGPFASSFSNKKNFKFKFSSRSWEFRILIEFKEKLYSYQPRSDFQFLSGGLPRLLVEIQSQGDRADHHRMLIQAAFVVRFANEHVQKYKEMKNFFLVTAYITKTGTVRRSIIYQDGNKVQYTTPRVYILHNKDGQLQFIRELYNLASHVAVETAEDASDAKTQVGALTVAFEDIAKNPEVDAWTGKSTCTSKWFGGEEEQRTGGADSEDELAEELKEVGYLVDPVVFIDDSGGIWEEIGAKLPPALRTVYKKSDVQKTNRLIAKRVCKSSSRDSELAILTHLHADPSPSPYIISLSDHVAVGSAAYLIFPRLTRVSDDALRNASIARPSRSLVEGVAFLHAHGVAHLDLKPDNLLYDAHNGQLKIIDFDIAVRVESEEEEVEGIYGTVGWTAPEMGDGGDAKRRYSAIRADRWACGRVLEYFAKHGRGHSNRFSELAKRLLAKKPSERPSLVEWCGGVSSGGADAMQAGTSKMGRARQ